MKVDSQWSTVWTLLVHECKPMRYCTVQYRIGWIGPLHFIASRLELEADSVGRLVTLGQCWYTRVWPWSWVEYWPVNEMQWLKWMTERLTKWNNHWRSFHFQIFSNVGAIRRNGQQLNDWMTEWMAPNEHVSFQWLNICFLNDCLLLYKVCEVLNVICPWFIAWMLVWEPHWAFSSFF